MNFIRAKKGVDFSVSASVQLDGILKTYLDSVLKVKPIDRNWLAGFVKKHDDIVGVPPAKFMWEGKEYTPQTFAKEVLKGLYYNYLVYPSSFLSKLPFGNTG
jgi:bleomycin hydrolase